MNQYVNQLNYWNVSIFGENRSETSGGDIDPRLMLFMLNSSHPNNTYSSSNTDGTTFFTRLMHSTIGLILLFGFPGNLMALYVYCWKPGRSQQYPSSAQYIISIALSDLGVLIILLEGWIRMMFKLPPFHTIWTCVLITYGGYCGSWFCPWFIVAFTFERFFAVRNPLQRNNVLSSGRSRIVIGVMVLIGMIYNSVAFVVVDVNKTLGRCQIKLQYYDLVQKFDIVNSIFGILLPLVLHMVMNIWICVVLWFTKSKQQLRIHDNPQSIAYRKAAWKLLVISILYCAVNIPTLIIRMINMFHTSISWPSQSWIYLTKTTYLIYSAQYAIHAYTYMGILSSIRKTIETAQEELKMRTRNSRSLLNGGSIMEFYEIVAAKANQQHRGTVETTFFERWPLRKSLFKNKPSRDSSSDGQPSFNEPTSENEAFLPDQ